MLIARGSLNNASLAVNSHILGVQADDISSFEVKADGYWERSELLPTKRPHLSQGNLYYSVEWGCNSPLSLHCGNAWKLTGSRKAFCFGLHGQGSLADSFLGHSLSPEQQLQEQTFCFMNHCLGL